MVPGEIVSAQEVVRPPELQHVSGAGVARVVADGAHYRCGGTAGQLAELEGVRYQALLLWVAKEEVRVVVSVLFKILKWFIDYEITWWLRAS